MAAPLTIHLVRRAPERRRFREVGRVVHRGEPRWAPTLASYESWLLRRSHPYRRRADVAFFLARRGNDGVGRLAAHHEHGSADGRFGAFEAADDAVAVRALLDEACAWLDDRGCTTIRGPFTYTAGDEAGVQVAGHEHAGGTGRPWHPPWYAEHLTEAGLAPEDEVRSWWRLDLAPSGPTAPSSGGAQRPPHAGRLDDPRLGMASPGGTVVAVPDIAPALRVGSVRALRQPPREECAVVHVDGDPATLVPALADVAGAAGYRALWAPWAPGHRRPDTVYRLFGTALR